MFRYNPVLNRELIVNLRRNQSFALLLVYQLILATLILLAYPRVDRMSLTNPSEDARRLADFFFLGQFAIVSLMTPSFASGAIAGEKERKTYEMLLASPLRPMAIVVGKLIASLTHLLLLMFASLPIVFICLPLGGISIEEVFGAYISILFSILLFGSISIACSSIFKRVSSALVVSYMIILPLVLAGIVGWIALSNAGATRLTLTALIYPAIATLVSIILLLQTSRRLLYPADVGSMGEEVVDLEAEQRNAVGFVIQRDKIPDRFFAPPRRASLIADGANPVYDKELYAELFSQGTLMLRIVIQVSMFLAIPMMGYFLFIHPSKFYIYMDYVLTFNMLATSVFAAGSITSERERRTLDLLLTSPLSGWQILSGKFISSFRVSYVLTLFLMWPVVLATALESQLMRNWLTMLICTLIITVCAAVNLTTALFFSTLLPRTKYAMVATLAFVATVYFGPQILYELARSTLEMQQFTDRFESLGIVSPLMAIERVPHFYSVNGEWLPITAASFTYVTAYLCVSMLWIAFCTGIMSYRFAHRWQLTGHN